MSGFTIRKLVEGDLAATKALRLEALHLHPEAFSSDPERDAALTDEQWRERIAAGRWFGAFVNGELAGIVAWIPGHSRKTAHTGEIGGMYVRETARGTGAAGGLVEAAVADAAASEIEQMTLTVNADNARALHFYEKHGFRTAGRIPHALRVGGRSYDEITMWRPVSTSD